MLDCVEGGRYPERKNLILREFQLTQEAVGVYVLDGEQKAILWYYCFVFPVG